MVMQTIEKRGVANKTVLKAMKTVQRHLFVPESNVPVSYEDRPLGIGYGQTISQPFIVAYMMKLLIPNLNIRCWRLERAPVTRPPSWLK